MPGSVGDDVAGSPLKAKSKCNADAGSTHFEEGIEREGDS